MSPALMPRIALAEPAPPIMTNSSRPAFSMAARTPTPWSSSWFQMTSIFGAACSRLDAASSPDSTVNSAATRLSTFRPQRLQRVLEALGCGPGSAAASRCRRSRRRPASVLSLELLADVRAGRDAHAVVVAEDGGAGGERAVELAVDVDDRDAGLHRLGARPAVSAAPSNGSSTMASTLSLMKVSTWLICRLTSLVPSATLSSTSSYFSASALAALVMRGHPAVVGGRGRRSR